MKNSIDYIAQNQNLRAEFEKLGLNYKDLHYDFDDPSVENELLKTMRLWVDAYYEHDGEKEKMIEAGYLFPPVLPPMNPEKDWIRFEMWMRGEKIIDKLKNKLPGGYKVKNADHLTDVEIKKEIEILINKLVTAGMVVDRSMVNSPDRLIYQSLLDSLEDLIEVPMDDGWFYDFCSHICPDCHHRPWCGIGGMTIWQEDNEFNTMVLKDSLRGYVSPSPYALQVLKKQSKNGGEAW